MNKVIIRGVNTKKLERCDLWDGSALRRALMYNNLITIEQLQLQVAQTEKCAVRSRIENEFLEAMKETIAEHKG